MCSESFWRTASRCLRIASPVLQFALRPRGRSITHGRMLFPIASVRRPGRASFTLMLGGLLAGLGAFAITVSAQESKPAGKPNFPESLPGRGLAQHDFLYAGESKTRDIYLVRGGQVVWEYHDPSGRGEISDAIRLSNGNILYAHQFGIKLINQEKQVLWNYAVPAGCEAHTAQPIGTNRVIFLLNGPEPKIIVANLASGKMERELPLPVGNPKSTHGQTRHARLTEAGTYLVAHMDKRTVAEYDESGKTVWSASVPGAWSAVRLKNGNTLVCGRGAQEIDPQGKTVWEFSSADVPDYKFNNWQIATRLPNGNTLMNCWVNSWSEKIDPETAPVQALEVTPDKKVVWALRSWKNPNLGPSTTIQLLDTPDAPENAHFGSIR